MRHTLPLLALLLGPAFAGVATGPGTTSETFLVSATVANACTLTVPSTPVAATPTVYWAPGNTASGEGRVNVKCNVGAVYTLGFQAPAELLLDGVTGNPSIPLAFDGPSVLDEIAGIGGENTAATPGGQDYPFTFTAGPSGQEDPSGTYSNAVVVTLEVIDDGGVIELPSE